MSQRVLKEFYKSPHAQETFWGREEKYENEILL